MVIMKIQSAIFFISIEAAALLALIGCGTISSSTITFTPKSTSSMPTKTQNQSHEITPTPISSRTQSPTPTKKTGSNIALNPSINYLVYARDEPIRGTGEALVYSLRALDPSGQEIGSIFLGAGPETRISPDCSYMTFFPEVETTVSNYAPVMLDLNSGATLNLDNIYGDVSTDWSPDGKRIVIDEGEEISVLDLNSNQRATLTACKADPNFSLVCYYPSWEPEGNLIAYYKAYAASGEPNKVNGVYLVNPDCTTQGLSCVSVGPLPLSEFFGWSPDGRKLASPGRKLASQNFLPIKVFDLPREKVTQEFKVMSNGESSYIKSIVWSPDSTSLTFSMDYGLYSLDLKTGEQKILSKPDMDQDGAPLAKEALFWEDGACLQKIAKWSR
jgi:Tol biopolymer transport system component